MDQAIREEHRPQVFMKCGLMDQGADSIPRTDRFRRIIKQLQFASLDQDSG
jgi:hypothetical protein